MKKLAVIGTFVAGVTVGFTACGALVVNKVLKSERHRDGLAKAISEKVDEWLYGENKYETYRSPKYNTTYVSYRNYSNNKCTKNFIFKTREKAEATLTTISDLINECGSVSVAEVCDICCIVPDYTDSEYGWNTADDMKVIITRNGYELYLPKPIEL